jgi:putative spermidine/putrescine transport system ATP-binding protein
LSYLELVDLSKAYGSARAVEGINLQIAAGEFVSLLGPSGCGKSTTLRMIAGLETPSGGAVRLAGEDITHRPVNRRSFGLVFQNYALFPNLTVTDNVAFGLRIARLPRPEIERRVAEMLALIKMGDLGHRYPHQLSGGQQQRVALARALAIRPRLLLLDEPLSALDAKIREDLRVEIRAIQRQLGITTIYVTHDQEEALSLSDRIVVMRQGHIDQIGTPDEIYNAPATGFVASFVGALNRLNAQVIDPAAGQLAIDGQVIVTTHPLPAAALGRTALLGIRPQNVSVSDASNGHVPANQLTGSVEGVSFLGAIVRVQLSLGTNRLSFDLLNRIQQPVPKPGEQIRITLPPEACFILDLSV